MLLVYIWISTLRFYWRRKYWNSSNEYTETRNIKHYDAKYFLRYHNDLTFFRVSFWYMMHGFCINRTYVVQFQMYVTKNKTKCTCVMEVLKERNLSSTKKSFIAVIDNGKLILLVNFENLRNFERGPLVSFIAQMRSDS